MKGQNLPPLLSFCATALLSRSSCSILLPFAIILTTVSMCLNNRAKPLLLDLSNLDVSY